MQAEKLGAAYQRLTALYGIMSDSTDRVDRDSAEFFRLGSIILRDARLQLMEARDAPPGAAVAEPIPEEIVATFRRYAGEYLKTGARLLDDYVVPVGPMIPPEMMTAHTALGAIIAPVLPPSAKDKPPGEKPKPPARPAPPQPPEGFRPNPDYIDQVAEFITEVLV